MPGAACCWELDALSPVVLRQRVEREITKLIDWNAWARAGEVERLEQQSLTEVMGKWREAISWRATE